MRGGVKLKRIDEFAYKNIIKPFLWNRKEVLRYWLNQLWLTHGNYFYELSRDSLFLYKKGCILGKRFFIMPVPPMRRDGDITKELDLFQYKINDIPIIISDDPPGFKQISVQNPRIKFYLKSREYVFQYPKDLGGYQWKSWRWINNQFDRSPDLWWSFSRTTDLPPDGKKDIETIITRWIAANGAYSGVWDFLQSMNSLADTWVLLTHEHGIPIGFRAVQMISETTAVGLDMKTSRLISRKKVAHRINRFLMYKPLLELSKTYGNNVFLNSGVAHYPGMRGETLHKSNVNLVKSKKEFHPVKILHIYRACSIGNTSIPHQHSLD